jgi:adenylate kinase family enzyme
MEKNLYIVRGLPGSGKSTFARSIAKPYQIFEADQYFMKK